MILITQLLSFLILVIIIIIVWAYWRFNKQIAIDIHTVYSSNCTVEKIITKEMIQHLPSPVQRYLNYTGVVDRPIPHTVRLKQIGSIRKDQTSSWMNLHAEQYYSINPPGFVWKAYIPHRLFPIVLGRDKYIDAKGSILMKLFALFNVADQKSDQMNNASLMRYLNEMMWFPQAYLCDNITWTAINDTSAKVTLTHKNNKATATLMFDAVGKLTNFSALRYNTETGKNEYWETPILAYGEFNGLKIPYKGRALYKRVTEDLEYIHITITNLIYT